MIPNPGPFKLMYFRNVQKNNLCMRAHTCTCILAYVFIENVPNMVREINENLTYWNIVENIFFQ